MDYVLSIISMWITAQLHCIPFELLGVNLSQVLNDEMPGQQAHHSPNPLAPTGLPSGQHPALARDKGALNKRYIYIYRERWRWRAQRIFKAKVVNNLARLFSTLRFFTLSSMILGTSLPYISKIMPQKDAINETSGLYGVKAPLLFCKIKGLSEHRILSHMKPDFYGMRSLSPLAGLETQTQNAAFFERKRPKRKPWPRGKSLNHK